MTNLTWDDLPGEQALAFLSNHLDNPSENSAGYDLHDVQADLENIQRLATLAITLVDRGW